MAGLSLGVPWVKVTADSLFHGLEEENLLLLIFARVRREKLLFVSY